MITCGISYIDLAIVFGLLIFIYKGYERGFTEEFMRILGTLVSLILAIRYMSDVSRVIIGATNMSPIIAVVISFVIIFFAVIYLFKFITERLKKAISFSVALGSADKVVGGALGLAKGAILISLVTILLSFFSFSDVLKRHFTESALFKPMQRIAPLAYDAFKVFVPRPKSFILEFEENFSGVSKYKRAKESQEFIESLKKK